MMIADEVQSNIEMMVQQGKGPLARSLGGHITRLAERLRNYRSLRIDEP
jgi:hypothetical protein